MVPGMTGRFQIMANEKIRGKVKGPMLFSFSPIHNTINVIKILN